MTMSKSIKRAAVAAAIGALCAALEACVSDTGTPLTKTSDDAQDHAPLRYYGGPKSPMWPDR